MTTTQPDLTLKECIERLERDASARDKAPDHAPWPWRQAREEIVDAARIATPEEMAELRFFERLEKTVSGRQMAHHTGLVAPLIENGSIWSDQSDLATRDALIAFAFKSEPARLGPFLADRPEWAEISVEHDFHGELPRLARKNRDIADALELADAKGRLARLAAAGGGLGAQWLSRCIVAGDLAAGRRAVAAGLRLDSLGQEESLQLFAAAICEKAAVVVEKSTALKHEAWGLAIEAGLRKIEWSESSDVREENIAWGCKSFASGLATMAREAERGGGLGGVGRALWIHASLAKGWPEPRALIKTWGVADGQTPFEWAVDKGLDPSLVTQANLEAGIPAPEMGWRVIEGLGGLNRKGVRMGADARPAGRGDGVIHRAQKFQLKPEVIAALVNLGADVGRPNHSGKTPLQALMEAEGPTALNRAKKFLFAIEAGRPGAADEAWAAPGKDGSKPIHWAAKSLNLAMMEWAESRGETLAATDSKGNTAAHWAASKYSAGKDAKSQAMIAWMDRHGIDWMATNRKGDTAAAVYARRGTGARALEAIRRAPAVATAGNKKGESALDALGARNMHWRAEAESVVLASELRETIQASADAAGKEGDPSSSSGSSPRRVRRM